MASTSTASRCCRSSGGTRSGSTTTSPRSSPAARRKRRPGPALAKALQEVRALIALEDLDDRRHRAHQPLLLALREDLEHLARAAPESRRAPAGRAGPSP